MVMISAIEALMSQRLRRKSSRRALYFLKPLLPPRGCAVLCLLEPPPHHTPNHTATQVAGAVRGACKRAGAAVSYDPTDDKNSSQGMDAVVDWVPFSWHGL
nr:hypothetical protein CFP56_58855 [Quercus suber]